ncbi:MAG TPA: LysR family transcriptional regulator [Polyangiaceae bacterium]|nr:LysR family transcriptional regulator [Polyangiaceae bacterium]
MTDPSWELHRSFLSVARERSLSGAARVLGLTQPTVGRHVDALEEALGGKLFTRSRSGLLPTSLALSLLPHVEAMASAAEALQRTASGDVQEERGVVRVTASEMIGSEVLPSAFASFRERHPGIAFELVLSNRTEDLLRREADVAVRMVKPEQQALVAKKVASLGIGLFAHPRYVKLHGRPRSIEELASHPIIGFDRAPSIRSAKLPVPFSRDLFAFRCDTEPAQYAALRAGFGVGGAQIALGKRDGLVRILPELTLFEMGVWIVMHRDAKENRRVRLVFDHLAEALRAHAALEHAADAHSSV